MLRVFLLFVFSISLSAKSEEFHSTISEKMKITKTNLVFRGVGEIYSETFSRPSFDSITNDSRFRYLLPMPVEKLQFYIGLSLEREVRGRDGLIFLQDATSPTVGFLYRPTSFLNLWIEHRQRFQKSESDSNPGGVADPRIGASTGFFLGKDQRFVEAYGEVVLLPRLSREAVASASIRPFLRQELSPSWKLDAYSELYALSSPDSSFGPSRSQVRAGLRLGWQPRSWQISLLAYKPWGLSAASEAATDPDFEALLVIGGSFQ